jgi:AraC-like DNA-binding protein
VRWGRLTREPMTGPRDDKGEKPLGSGHQDLLERLSGLAPGRRPLSDFLKLSGDAGEDELRAVRSFLFDLYCRIYKIEPGSETEAKLRFRLLHELAKGKSVEEITSLFIGNLYLTRVGGDTGIGAEPVPQRSRPRGLADQARLLIEERYTERLSLGRIATELAVSKEHLSRIFKKKFSATVTEHIHRTRIENAKRLISTAEFSLKQICYETGYQSYNDFYRNFRKIAGVSPKDFVGDGSTDEA